MRSVFLSSPRHIGSITHFESLLWLLNYTWLSHTARLVCPMIILKPILICLIACKCSWFKFEFGIDLISVMYTGYWSKMFIILSMDHKVELFCLWTCFYGDAYNTYCSLMEMVVIFVFFQAQLQLRCIHRIRTQGNK